MIVDLLPKDLFINICSQLPTFKDIARIGTVCKKWQQWINKNDIVWKNNCLKLLHKTTCYKNSWKSRAKVIHNFMTAQYDQKTYYCPRYSSVSFLNKETPILNYG